MALTDGNGLPLAIDVEAANCAEVTLIERLLDLAITERSAAQHWRSKSALAVARNVKPRKIGPPEFYSE